MIIHQPNHPDHRLSFRQLTGIGGDRLVAGLARGLDDGNH
jgi:hypothetical protein